MKPTLRVGFKTWSGRQDSNYRFLALILQHLLLIEETSGNLNSVKNEAFLPAPATYSPRKTGQADGVFDPFVGGEALPALDALPPPANRPPAFAGAGIDHLQAFLIRVAERAAHWCEM